MRHGTLTPGK
jgi:ABC-type sugar transport system substrate-binding protein